MGISGELQRGRWGELAQGASALSTRPSESTGKAPPNSYVAAWKRRHPESVMMPAHDATQVPSPRLPCRHPAQPCDWHQGVLSMLVTLIE